MWCYKPPRFSSMEIVLVVPESSRCIYNEKSSTPTSFWRPWCYCRGRQDPCVVVRAIVLMVIAGNAHTSDCHWHTHPPTTGLVLNLATGWVVFPTNTPVAFARRRNGVLRQVLNLCSYCFKNMIVSAPQSNTLPLFRQS